MDHCTDAIGSVLKALPNAGLRGDVRSEWDETKQHDVLFLLTVQPPDQVALGAIRDRGEEPTPAQKHGLIYVRGAEVIEVRHLCTVLLPVRGERCTDKTKMHNVLVKGDQKQSSAQKCGRHVCAWRRGHQSELWSSFYPVLRTALCLATH